MTHNKRYHQYSTNHYRPSPATQYIGFIPNNVQVQTQKMVYDNGSVRVTIERSNQHRPTIVHTNGQIHVHQQMTPAIIYKKQPSYVYDPYTKRYYVI